MPRAKVSIISREIPDLTVLTFALSVSSQNKVSVGSDIVVMTHVLRFSFSALVTRALFTQTIMLFDQFDICFVKLITSFCQILGGRCGSEIRWVLSYWLSELWGIVLFIPRSLMLSPPACYSFFTLRPKAGRVSKRRWKKAPPAVQQIWLFYCTKGKKIMTSSFLSFQ